MHDDGPFFGVRKGRSDRVESLRNGTDHRVVLQRRVTTAISVAAVALHNKCSIQSEVSAGLTVRPWHIGSHRLSTEHLRIATGSSEAAISGLPPRPTLRLHGAAFSVCTSIRRRRCNWAVIFPRQVQHERSNLKRKLLFRRQQGHIMRLHHVQLI